jgi:hypothetical protein
MTVRGDGDLNRIDQQTDYSSGRRGTIFAHGEEDMNDGVRLRSR